MKKKTFERKNLRALVTGASSGMGAVYSRTLASQGWDLLMISNKEEELNAAGSDIRAQYDVDVRTLYMDLARETSADELYAYCEEQGLDIEVLVNNAGAFFFKEQCPEVERKTKAMLYLHMLTVERATYLFGQKMKTRGHGYILIMSSLAARLPCPGITIYNSTKAFLRNYGLSMYYEMKPYGITVSTVCPGAIATPLYNLKPSLMNLGVKVGAIHTPQWLVNKALKRLFAGKMLTQPGLLNVFLPPLIKLMPRGLITYIWKKVSPKL